MKTPNDHLGATADIEPAEWVSADEFQAMYPGSRIGIDYGFKESK